MTTHQYVSTFARQMPLSTTSSRRSKYIGFQRLAKEKRRLRLTFERLANAKHTHGVEILYSPAHIPVCPHGAADAFVLPAGSLLLYSYFHMSVIGAAARSLAVNGSNPKLSSMVRNTL